MIVILMLYDCVQVVALPYLHETLKPLIDLIFSEHKLVELDPDQLR